MHQDHDIKWLLIGITGICGLAWLTNTLNPNWLTALIFFCLLFFTVFTWSMYATNIVRRSILIGGGVVGFFLLRLIDLHEIWYTLLLIACLVSLELHLNKR